MTIVQLRYFQTVAQQENFTRAADVLHIAQSTLSKSVAKLEEELGLELFERDWNRVYLNKFGNFFLKQINNVLRSLDDSILATR